MDIPNNFLDMVEFYRKNPVIALEDLLNIELAVPQRVIFNSMWDHKFTIITAGRGNGKSFLLAAFASLRGMLFPGTRIGLLAPSFRQSKIMFEEVRRIWFAAPIFKEATSGKPTFQSDRCILNFRAIGTTPPSLIEADPLGTGEKIRGLRMHILLVDEFAQMPEEIFSAVVKPMAATSSSPMERVKLIQRMQILRDRGEIVEDTGGANKIIMASSAFYKFNHMYKSIEQYEKFISQGSQDHAVCSVNYLDMPAGFMNDDIIKEARDTMASSLFRMEYLAMWESDSDGVFKASLLESRKLDPGDSVKLEGEAGKEYVIACDPARTSDYCSVIVIELGDRNKVVNAYKYHKYHFPQMADMLMQICGRYNVVRLVVDSQGGGLAIKDLLADSSRYGNNIIIDIDDEEYKMVEGRRILQMFNPSPTTNSDANFATINLLEQGRLWFAGVPLSGKEEEESAFELITELIKQMLNIVLTQTKSGTIHFDVPSGEGHGSQKKDLYSALIYAAHKAYQLRLEREPTNILWNSGIVVPKGSATRSEPRPMLVSPHASLKRVKND